MKIAIIGAGFAGLATASVLDGHDITIYEQAPELKPVGAGVLIQPFGLSVLRALDLDEQVIQSGDKINRLYGLTTNDKSILNLRYDKYESDYFGVGIHRGTLFNLLLDKAKLNNPKILINTEIFKIENYHQNPRVIFSDGSSSDPFDLMIVANGSKSALRSLLTGRKFEQEYPWGALWGVFDNVDIDTSTLFQRYDNTTKLLGFLPCGKHPVTKNPSVSFFWSLRSTAYDTLKAKGIENFKEELRKFDPACTSVLSQINSLDDFSYVTYTDVHIKKWMEGKVLFIGDSVHGMSPQLGLGANMAIYDGWLTGELLKNGGINSLHKISDIRKKQNVYYHRVSRLMTPFFQSDHKLLGHLRDAVFPILPTIGFLDRLMVETLYGLRDGVFSKREVL